MAKQIEDFKLVLEWLQKNIDKPDKPVLFVCDDLIFLKGTNSQLLKLLEISEERLEPFDRSEEYVG